MSAERVRDLIPFVHVSDVGRSIAFYELLGFEPKGTQECDGRLDLAALRDRLLAAGVAVGEIRDGSPGPARELGLADPDGGA
jgi:hypothetical protein